MVPQLFGDYVTMLQKGDTVWVLSEYQWVRAEVMTTPKDNSKSVLLGGVSYYTPGYTWRASIDKVAKPDEKICIVWEKWKGKNGRGGYRLDKTMYPQYHVNVNQVGPSYRNDGTCGRVTESEFGVLRLM
jgi:hypothetical protein